MRLFKGDIIHTKTPNQFEVFEDGYILEDNGIVVEVGFELDKKYPIVKIIDHTGRLLLPSFVDLHTHAVQYANLGLGLDEELLSWLEIYTFKEEAKFSDISYAKKVFSYLLDDIVKAGTTRVVFFGSIHEEATELLIEMSIAKGIGAYIGKVNMDRNAPDSLLEDSDNSVAITKRLLRVGNDKVKSIITPRFAPSCSEKLMRELGELEDKLEVQTHISENRDEIKWIEELFPDAKSYLDVYLKNGLISNRTILAHAIFSTKEELSVIKEKGAFIAHCPSANVNLTSGVMDAKFYLDQGINLGLGTDVGAGDSLSIRKNIVLAIQMSKINHIISNEKKILSFSEAFYLATKRGGSYFGKVGSFEKGYKLDMLVIERDKLADIKDFSLVEKLQRFIYSGNDEMILERYCEGVKLFFY